MTLVNNAGIFVPQPIAEAYEEWQRAWSHTLGNLVGAANVTWCAGT